MPDDVPIRRAPIELDRFLKLTGAVASGGEARHLIDDGLVRVNGEVEHRRRRQLQIGDVVDVAGEAMYRVMQAEEPRERPA